jgi:arabinogalactan oligomer/maltooligosaccharide transport system substrate-binding protein
MNKLITPSSLQMIMAVLIPVLVIAGCSQFLPTETPTPVVVIPTLPQPTIPPTATTTATPIVIQGTVRIWHSWNELEVPVLDQIIKEFSAQYPNVYFDVLYIPIDNLRSRFEMAVIEGNAPDLLLGPADWAPGLYESGFITELTGILDAQTLEMLNQPAINAATIDGKLVGLPYSIRGTVLFRNRNIIPDSAVSFDQLVYNANAADKGDQVGAMLDRSLLYSGAILEGIGGQMMDVESLPAFNDDKGLEWVQLLERYEEAGPTDYFTDQDVDLFKQGKVGIIVEGSWRLREFSEAIGAESLAIDRWPDYGDFSLSGYVLPENIYLNSSTSGDRLLSAQNFMRHFVSTDAQTRIAEMGQVPSARDIILTDPITGTLVSKAMSAMSDGVAYPIAPEWEVFQLPLDLALRSIFSDTSVAQDALQSAHDEIIKAILEMNVEPAAALTPTP